MIGILRRKASKPAPEAPPAELPKMNSQPPAMGEANPPSFEESRDTSPRPPFANEEADEDMPLPPPFMRPAPEEPKRTASPMPSAMSLAKGPVFVSLDKYREVKQMLYELKKASAELHQTIATLKQNRDDGNALLSNSVEMLSTIEAKIENISATLRLG